MQRSNQLQRGASTLRKWMRNEALPYLRVEGVVLIPRQGVERWMAERVETENRSDALAEQILGSLAKQT